MVPLDEVIGLISFGRMRTMRRLTCGRQSYLSSKSLLPVHYLLIGCIAIWKLAPASDYSGASLTSSSSSSSSSLSPLASQSSAVGQLRCRDAATAQTALVNRLQQSCWNHCCWRATTMMRTACVWSHKQHNRGDGQHTHTHERNECVPKSGGNGKRTTNY